MSLLQNDYDSAVLADTIVRFITLAATCSPIVLQRAKICLSGLAGLDENEEAVIAAATSLLDGNSSQP